ncbi:MAG: iron-sulfur cluster assembly scaffold protein [Candidatus ainarchaeum sp.]|nr:iron-sulfur cluster assembly scaffold protein [Candidatus ainarchaeum sp.]
MDIYMDRILELHRNPENMGEIPDADIKKLDYNPSCGDMVSVFVKMKDGKVADAKFRGQGCAISMASASLLMGAVKGKTLDEIGKMGQKEVFELLGVDLSRNPSRIKCAMLPLIVLKKGIKER